MAYVKMWFGRAPYDENDLTAALIMNLDKVRDMTLNDISRLFPMSESPKMHKLFRSPQFPTWNEAFSFDHTQPR